MRPCRPGRTTVWQVAGNPGARLRSTADFCRESSKAWLGAAARIPRGGLSEDIAARQLGKGELRNSLSRSMVDLFAAALSQICDQIFPFLRFRDQEIHVIAGDKSIGIREPFVQRRFVPHDICLLQGGRVCIVTN
jgi:hypothetical protein